MSVGAAEPVQIRKGQSAVFRADEPHSYRNDTGSTARFVLAVRAEWWCGVSARLVSMIVVVTALTGHHLAQRSMPGGVRPAPLFAFVYGVAAFVMIAAVTLEGSGGMRAVSGAATHWAPWLLVLSVAGIELGVYAMYRTGWSISTASVSTQAIVAAILVAVGLWQFGEHLTPSRLAGLAMCVLGAGLVAR